MVKPQCPKPGCGSTGFDAPAYQSFESGTWFRLVMCTKCGTVVGAYEHTNIGEVLADLSSTVHVLIKRLDKMDEQKPSP